MNYQAIKLIGGQDAYIDADQRVRCFCKGCSVPLRFAVNNNGKKIPVIKTTNGYQLHFGCNDKESQLERRINEEEENQKRLNNL
jgi:hypothetical protein